MSQQASNLDLMQAGNTESMQNLGAQAANGEQQPAAAQNALGLTELEEKKCEQAFKAFDKDDSKDVDIDELRIVLRMMGISVTEAKL